MSVKVSDFKHSIEVHLFGVGECVVAFDIIEEDDHGGPMVDFAVFCEDKPVTYDLDRRQYNYCMHTSLVRKMSVTLCVRLFTASLRTTHWQTSWWTRSGCAYENCYLSACRHRSWPSYASFSGNH